MKQTARYQYVSCVILPPPILWCNQQTKTRLILRNKPKKRHGDCKTQITKSELSILRPKLKNRMTLVLGLNKETCATHIHMHDTDRSSDLSIVRPPNIWSVLDHLQSFTLDLLLLLIRSSSLFAMSYLSPMSQANTIFHTNNCNNI
jgi:hypothetical protein